MTPAIPKIEIADHAHPLRRRRKDGEGHAFHAIEHDGMGAELVVEMQMRPFAEQVEIEIGQDRWETVGILDLNLAFAIARAQAVVSRPVAQATLEQAGIVDALEIAF